MPRIHRDVRLRLCIHRTDLRTGRQLPCNGILYTDSRHAHLVAEDLNLRCPETLHDVEEIELPPNNEENYHA